MYHVRIIGSTDTLSVHEGTKAGLSRAIFEARMRAENTMQHYEVFNDEDGMVMHVVVTVPNSPEVASNKSAQVERMSRRIDRFCAFVCSAALAAILLRMLIGR